MDDGCDVQDPIDAPKVPFLKVTTRKAGHSLASVGFLFQWGQNLLVDGAE